MLTVHFFDPEFTGYRQMLFRGVLFFKVSGWGYLKGQVQVMQDMFITSKKPMMLEQRPLNAGPETSRIL
jgi:hypothetical protein